MGQSGIRKLDADHWLVLARTDQSSAVLGDQRLRLDHILPLEDLNEGLP